MSPVKPRHVWLFSGAFLIAIMLVASHTIRDVSAQRQQRAAPVIDVEKYNPQVAIPRPFPAIKNPPHVSADEAAAMLQPNELVLGVEMNGESRAYPINMLTNPTREIFNDTLGKRRVAATW